MALCRPEPLRTEVRAAFAASLASLWKLMIWIGVAGAVIALGMKNLPMTDALDENWGLDGPETTQLELDAPLRPPPPLTSYRHMSLQRLSANYSGFGRPESLTDPGVRRPPRELEEIRFS